MKNHFLFLLLTALVGFFALAPVTGCSPKKDVDKAIRCANGVKDGDETGVDCGGTCSACINPCDTIVCQNGGTCATGACNCPTGFTGSRCQTAVETRTKFLGAYNVSGTVSGGGSTDPLGPFITTVTAGTGSTTALNFSTNIGGGQTVYFTGNVSSTTGAVAIPLQTDSNSGLKYQGTASFTTSSVPNTLQMNFTETPSSGNANTVSLSGPKQ